MPRNHSFTLRLSLILCAIVSLARAGLAQQPPAAAPADTAAPQTPPLKQEELDQMIAPLALYPDSLLSQIFMASTYPLEVVQADRWVKANKALTGDALSRELEKQTWGPSVKSLVNFPDILAMMSEKLDLTIKLGDAFIAQQADVMNTVQRLRAKAQAEGQLKSNEQQKVTVEPAPVADPTVVVQTTPPPAQVIVIEPTNPQVIYVPSYNPAVVYGGWPYPSYPPAPYYPPGYVASNVLSFGLGVAAGAAWGYAWGNCNWGHGDVDVDINRNTNINNNIDRSKYQNNYQNRQNNFQGGKGSWQHNPAHREGVPYRDRASDLKYGQGNQDRQAAAARDAYRGRADTGRQDLARGGADQYRGNNAAGGAQNRPGGGPGAGGAGVQNRPAGAGPGAGGAGVQNRPAGSAQPRPAGGAQPRPVGAQARPTPTNRPPPSGNSGAFGSVDRGGAAARTSSQRGQASRAASPSPAARPSPSRSASGGGRTGGGGGRR